MSKKIIAIIAEIIPIISAALSYALLVSKYDSAFIRTVIAVGFILSFLGFVFFFIGRWLAKESRAVRILGIFDWLASVFIIAVYVIAFLVMGA